jgi:hypothetical protein
MTHFGIASAVVGIAYALFWHSPAIACTTRQSFFSGTAEGTLALVQEARTPADVRRFYSGWCAVAPNTRVISQARDVVYFALNNRDDEAGTPKFYIVKIFRRSRATALRPLVSLYRSGPWAQRFCPTRGQPRIFKRVFYGESVVARFLERVRLVRGNQSGPCDDLGAWLADAHGDRSLSLSTTANFLLETPQRVSSSGIDNWSLNVSAFSYRTEANEQRGAPFPQLHITRDGADEIIIQYMSSGSKYHEFTLSQ